MQKKIFFLFFLFITVSHGHAQETQPWTFQADRLKADRNADIVEGFGNIVLQNRDSLLKADYVRYHPKSRSVLLRGKVWGSWGDSTFNAQEATFNLQDKTGTLHNGSFFMAEPHLYLFVEQAEKTGEKSYTFKNASVTGCDGESPVWSFQSRDGKFTLDGYAWLYGTKFQLKKHSVLYTPFLALPIKEKRQTGLLRPEIFQSNRLGLVFNQPLYLALDKEQDLTFYENFIFQKGLMQGFEYRHTNNPETFGLWHLDWLYDRQTARTETAEDRQFQGDSLTRPNHNRYWLRSKLNSEIWDWEIKLDLDIVSDQNYLREFKKGLSGFTKSEQAFREKFGRGLAENDNLLRPSVFLLGKNFSGHDLFFKTKFQQNLAYMNDNLPTSRNPTIQSLPELYFYWHPSSLADSAWQWDFTMESGYYWRKVGQSITRFDLAPRLMRTLHTPYLSLTSKIGWLQSLILNENDSFSKGSFLGELDVFQNVFRVYHHKNLTAKKDTTWTHTRHSIIPRLSYTFLDNTDIPESVAVKKSLHNSRHELRYSLKNVFTSRYDTKNREEQETKRAYHDFFTCKLEQSYDIQEARRNEDRKRYKRRPFSDIMVELSLRPQEIIELYNRTWFSPYDKKINEHEHGLKLFSRTWGEVSFGLDIVRAIDEYSRHHENDVKILNMGCKSDFLLPWQIEAYMRSDLKTHRELERKVILSYIHQCFSLDFIHDRTDYDNSFEVRFTLGTLGSVNYGH